MPKQKSQLIVSGTIVYGDDFEGRAGYAVIEGGKIKEIGEGGKIEADVTGIVIPSFVNAHTHIGDSAAKEPDFMPLDLLVGPGGYKHKILAETAHNKLVSSMRDSIEDIFATGTGLFADFREGGILGVKALKEAFDSAKCREKLDMKIFGRPEAGTDELRITNYELRIFESADGIGISSVADYPWEDVKRLAAETKTRGKMFALHAGERNAEDVEGAIELEPDFIVHLTKASQQDFEKMRNKNIAAVVCIRSNLMTGMGLPPLRQMLKAGLTVGVGTDNVMLNSPDMFSEMEFIAKIFRKFDERKVLKMCTLDSAKVLKEDKFVGSIEEGKTANLLVIDNDTPNMRGVRNSIRGVVRRATRNDIAAVIYEGEVVK